ncbi:hypothetical protein ABW19_dt0207470 [Dactylella cylindrospora]|nr:hypothetical protein ABW19_dt0207470 [Dactylella cylindrospora]
MHPINLLLWLALSPQVLSVAIPVDPLESSLSTGLSNKRSLNPRSPGGLFSWRPFSGSSGSRGQTKASGAASHHGNDGSTRRVGSGQTRAEGDEFPLLPLPVYTRFRSNSLEDSRAVPVERLPTIDTPPSSARDIMIKELKSIRKPEDLLAEGKTIRSHVDEIPSAAQLQHSPNVAAIDRDKGYQVNGPVALDKSTLDTILDPPNRDLYRVMTNREVSTTGYSRITISSSPDSKAERPQPICELAASKDERTVFITNMDETKDKLLGNSVEGITITEQIHYSLLKLFPDEKSRKEIESIQTPVIRDPETQSILLKLHDDPRIRPRFRPDKGDGQPRVTYKIVSRNSQHQAEREWFDTIMGTRPQSSIERVFYDNPQSFGGRATQTFVVLGKGDGMVARIGPISRQPTPARQKLPPRDGWNLWALPTGHGRGP